MRRRVRVAAAVSLGFFLFVLGFLVAGSVCNCPNQSVGKPSTCNCPPSSLNVVFWLAGAALLGLGCIDAIPIDRQGSRQATRG